LSKNRDKVASLVGIICSKSALKAARVFKNHGVTSTDRRNQAFG